MEINYLDENDPLRHLQGVGFDEPREALKKYETAVHEMAEQCPEKSYPEVTPRILEACRTYQALRRSVNKKSSLPDQLTEESAKKFIRGIKVSQAVGL